MIAKVKKTIAKYNLLEKGEGVIIAHSGGPDSTALLIILAEIARAMDLTLIIAHFNHGLRGRASDADERFSRNLAKKMGLSFSTGKMNGKSTKKGVSPEDFYRRQRYDFLEKVAKDYHAQKIAVGHNMNDQAETVLLNILRGSGLEGLKGFLPKRDGRIIRPLMEISRQEIILFLKERGIAYRKDKTNENDVYVRNRVRSELIPYLTENYNPQMEANLAQMAEILRNEDEFIRQHLAKALQSPAVIKNKNQVSLNIHRVKKMLPAMRWRLFKTILEDLSPEHNGISFAHIMSLEDLTEKNTSGRKVVLPMKIEARREYDHLIVEKKINPEKAKSYHYKVLIPGTIYVKERNVMVKTHLMKKRGIDFGCKDIVYLNMDKVHLPITIRNRREGDWIQPLGMAGRQTIKKYFIDHKVLPSRRDQKMLFVDDLSVIYIEDGHLSNRVKITPKTKNILKLQINRL